MKLNSDMTKIEAHKFIAHWRRILIPWTARTEAQALKNMKLSCAGMLVGGLPLLLCNSHLLVLIGLIQSIFSAYLVLRFQEVERALSQSPIVNRKS